MGLPNKHELARLVARDTMALLRVPRSADRMSLCVSCTHLTVFSKVARLQSNRGSPELVALMDAQRSGMKKRIDRETYRQNEIGSSISLISCSQCPFC